MVLEGELPFKLREMSEQRTCKLVTKIISDGENNFKQNKCNKWMKYRNILPNHKNVNMGSSAVHLHGVDLIDILKHFAFESRRRRTEVRKMK